MCVQVRVILWREVLDYFNLVKDQPVGIFIIKIDNLHQENSKLVSFALKWLVPTVKVFCLIIVQLLSQ